MLLWILLSQISNTSECLQFRAEQIVPIGLVQPAAAVIYDYSNPGERICGFSIYFHFKFWHLRQSQKVVHVLFVLRGNRLQSWGGIKCRWKRANTCRLYLKTNSCVLFKTDWCYFSRQEMWSLLQCTPEKQDGVQALRRRCLHMCRGWGGQAYWSENNNSTKKSSTNTHLVSAIWISDL